MPGRKSATDRKNSINVLSATEYQRWEKATEPVAQEWFKDVAAKGGDGPKLLAAAKALLSQFDK